MSKITKVSERGIEFIGKEEGLRLKPYLCSAKKATIGYGSTYYEDGTQVKLTDKPISKERAVSLFRNTLRNYETVVSSVIKSNINQNQFDALVSLSYNIGVGAFSKSTVVKRVNVNPNDPEIFHAFCMWKNAGGKPILMPRRKREAQLYFS